MSAAPGTPSKRLTTPRPGHADLAGMQKYGFDDARDVLERASARETAARVAAGALAKHLLSTIGMRLSATLSVLVPPWHPRVIAHCPVDLARVDESEVRCFDAAAEAAMIAEIKAAAKKAIHSGVSPKSLPTACGRSRELRALGPQTRWRARGGR